MNNPQNIRPKPLLASSYSPVKLIARPAPLSASSNEFLQIYPHAEYSPINNLQDSKLIKTFTNDLTGKNEDLSKKIIEKTQEIDYWKSKFEDSLRSLPVTEKKLMLLIEENEYLKKNGKNFNQEDLTEKIMKLEEGIQMVLSENDKLNIAMEEQLKITASMNEKIIETEQKVSSFQQENTRLLDLINEKDEEIFGLLEQKIFLKENGQEENESLQLKLSEKTREIRDLNGKFLENTEKFTVIFQEKSRMIEELQEKQRSDFEIQKDLQEKLLVLLEENGKLNKICEEHNNSLIFFREKVSTFSKERLDFEKFKQDLLQARSMIQEKDQKNQVLSANLAETRKEIDNLIQEKDQKDQVLSANLAETRKEIDNLKELLGDRERRLREKDETIRTKENDIKAIENELIELEEELERKQNEIILRTEELNCLKIEREQDIEEQSKTIAQLIQENKRKVDILKEEHIKDTQRQQEQDLQEHNGIIERLNQEQWKRQEEIIKIHEKERMELRKHLENMESVLRELRGRKEMLENENREYSNKIEELLEKERENLKLNEEKEGFKGKLGFMIEINEKMQGIIPEIFKKNSMDLENSLQKTTINFENERNELIELINERDEKISRLTQNVDSLLNENRRLVEKFEENRDVIESDRAELMENIRVKDVKISDMTRDLEAVLFENRKLVEKFEENRDFIQNYQKKCNDLLEKTRVFMLENDEKIEKNQLEAENRSLKQKIAETNENLSKKQENNNNFANIVWAPQEKEEAPKGGNSEEDYDSQRVFRELAERNNYGEINQYVLKLRESLQNMRKSNNDVQKSHKNKKNLREIREMFEGVHELKKKLNEAFVVGGKEVGRMWEEINQRISKLEEVGKEN